MAYVIGIDSGGTSTDALVVDESGRVAGTKTPSTPPNFSPGFPTLLDELAPTPDTDTDTGALLGETNDIVRGTTSTVNASVTGDVPAVGFLTTRRHAGSIAITNLERRRAGLGSGQVRNTPAVAR